MQGRDARTLDTLGLELNPCCNKIQSPCWTTSAPTTSFLDCRALAVEHTKTPTWTRVPFADAKRGCPQRREVQRSVQAQCGTAPW
jgi:hypothetical protein